MRNVITDMEFDVVIIGAGPAGISAGLTCALQGVSCCVLESMRLPRYKSCAGGLTPKSQVLLSSLGINAKEDLETAILSKLSFTSGKKNFVVSLEKPILALDRSDLDRCLQSRYRLLGAYLEDCAEIAQIDVENHIICRRSKPNIRYTYLICADGASGGLHEKLLTRRFNKVLGVEVSVASEWLESCEAFKGSDVFDLELRRGLQGYQWIVPRGKSSSIGMAFSKVDDLDSRLRQFMRQGLKLPRHLSEKIHGSFIPFGGITGSSVDIKNGIASVGDAAGYCDAISGEGIYFALSSGISAAKSICNGLAKHLDIETVMLEVSKHDLEFCKQIRSSAKLAALLYGNSELLLGLANSASQYFSRLIERHFITGADNYSVWKSLMKSIR